MKLLMLTQRAGVVVTCFAVAITANCLSATATENQPSKAEYVAMSGRAWKHFQCAYLVSTATGASHLANPFMQRGFELGRLYMQAMKDEKINLMDLTLKVPRPFHPNDFDLPIEFQLGRISKDAESEIAGEVLVINGEDTFSGIKAGKGQLDTEKMRNNARNLLGKNDCDFNDLGFDEAKLKSYQKLIQFDFTQKLPEQTK